MVTLTTDQRFDGCVDFCSVAPEVGPRSCSDDLRITDFRRRWQAASTGPRLNGVVGYQLHIALIGPEPAEVFGC
jgi:hypothetical protein